MVDGFISGLLVHFFCLQLLSLPMPALLDPVVEWLESAKQSRVRLLLIFLYYLVLEVGCGTTPGKLLTGSKVIDIHGGHPTRMQFLLRTLCRFIPFEPFSFLDRDGKGWHDSFTKTYVVRASSVRGSSANAA
jgi:uncharacterized RDD family membrane protein YckC